MTVGGRQFYVYRYEGGAKWHSQCSCYHQLSEGCVWESQSTAVVFSTDVSLSTLEILETYIKRWPIELFFRQSKSKLALDKYQLRSRQGIQRYWLIMSLVHFLCCMHSESYCAFEEGYAFLQKQLKQEQLTNLYRFIKSGASIEAVMELAG